jgi:hypothetical protein
MVYNTNNTINQIDKNEKNISACYYYSPAPVR